MAKINNINKISDINFQIYSNMKVVKRYSSGASLQEAEEAILNEIKEDIRGRKILDIGVGAGRTIPYLTKISSNYTGIDYSQPMVEECNKKYPEVNIICCDARDLSIFENDAFDFILFSANGIDNTSHNDRILILREIIRVLKKGGYFVFSAHNKDSISFKLYLSPFIPLVTHNPLNPFTLNPVEILNRFINLLRGMFNHLKNSKYVIHAGAYSIINDKLHDYDSMTYYITIYHQKEQLYKIGFKKPISSYDKYGEKIIRDSQDTWIYYLVRK